MKICFFILFIFLISCQKTSFFGVRAPSAVSDFYNLDEITSYNDWDNFLKQLRPGTEVETGGSVYTVGEKVGEGGEGVVYKIKGLNRVIKFSKSFKTQAIDKDKDSFYWEKVALNLLVEEEIPATEVHYLSLRGNVLIKDEVDGITFDLIDQELALNRNSFEPDILTRLIQKFYVIEDRLRVKGIVLSDLKPFNMMLSRTSGEMVIVDPGDAVRVSAEKYKAIDLGQDYVRSFRADGHMLAFIGKVSYREKISLDTLGREFSDFNSIYSCLLGLIKCNDSWTFFSQKFLKEELNFIMLNRITLRGKITIHILNWLEQARSMEGFIKKAKKLSSINSQLFRYIARERSDELNKIFSLLSPEMRDYKKLFELGLCAETPANASCSLRTTGHLQCQKTLSSPKAD